MSKIREKVREIIDDAQFFDTISNSYMISESQIETELFKNFHISEKLTEEEMGMLTNERDYLEDESKHKFGVTRIVLLDALNKIIGDSYEY